MSKRLHNLIWTFENYLAHEERQSLLDYLLEKKEKKESETDYSDVKSMIKLNYNQCSFYLDAETKGTLERKFLVFLIHECRTILLDFFNHNQGVYAPYLHQLEYRLNSDFVGFFDLDDEEQLHQYQGLHNERLFRLRYILRNPEHRKLTFFYDQHKYEQDQPENSLVMFPNTPFMPCEDHPAPGKLSFLEAWISLVPPHKY